MVTGRPGPVNLDVPYNVFQEEADVELPPAYTVFGAHRPGASDADVAAALDLLAAAAQAGVLHRPRRHAGRSRPRDYALSQRLGIPSSPRPTAWLRSADDALTLGFIGRMAPILPTRLAAFADLVITYRHALR